MLNKIYQFIFILLLTFQVALSQEIVVSGNERTKTSLILGLAKSCLEDYPIEQIGDFEQCILNSQLFSSVEVKKNNSIIEIKVEDRWTLIPVPFFRSQGEKRAAGFFLMERNFLGYGKMVVAGASFSNQGHSYFLMYNDPSFNFSDWTLSTRIRSSEDEIYLFEKGIRYNGFVEKELSIGIFPGYKLGSDLIVSFGPEWNKKEFGQLDTYSVSASTFEWSGVQTRINWSPTKYKLYFQEGIQVGFIQSDQIKRTDNDKKKHTSDLKINWQKSFFKDQVLQLGVSYSLMKNSNILENLRRGGGAGFRGVDENGLWLKNATSLSFDYQIPLLERAYGVWTIAPFVDYSTYENISSQVTIDTSLAYGAGVYLYMKKIALPGLGLLIGKNKDYEGGFVSFFIGRGL